MEQKKDSDAGGLGILLIFIGVYVLLCSLIDRRAKSLLTCILGHIFSALLVIMGSFEIYNLVDKAHPLSAKYEPAMSIFFFIVLGFYILCIVGAYSEDREYNKKYETPAEKPQSVFTSSNEWIIDCDGNIYQEKSKELAFDINTYYLGKKIK